MAINTASTAIDPPTLYTIFATPECDSEGNCKEQPLFAHGECFDFARCMQSRRAASSRFGRLVAICFRRCPRRIR
jgi:hypothetical protein